ncbi:MAG: peptidoglycan DD-metalloendopeptidase family protein [Kofleriaceae bacterium]
MLDRVAVITKPRSKLESRSVWPLPHQYDLNPTVFERAVADPDRLAVDIGYDSIHPRRSPFVPVFAVQDGTIAHVEKTGRGYAITLDHGHWFTSYSELEHAFVMNRSTTTRRRERVRAGDILGYVKWSAHVRFELWEFDNEGQLVPVDPEPHLRRWVVLPDLEQPVKIAAVDAVAA